MDTSTNVGEAIRGKLALERFDFGHFGKKSWQYFIYESYFVDDQESGPIRDPRNDTVKNLQLQHIVKSPWKGQVLMEDGIDVFTERGTCSQRGDRFLPFFSDGYIPRDP